jgi:hypothetical protein
MADAAKDTIYIDVDEEITGIVSKVSSSSKNIVALVLPKRAAVLQSIVNMKLLKRTADSNDKQVVLITSEARLLPLAGAAKLFVAPNLTSKPYIPPSPAIDESIDEPNDIQLDPETPVSQAAPDSKFADDETVEIDNTPKPEATAAAKPKKGGKKIPNFNSFRKKLIIAGILALLLIGLLVWAFMFAPKAKITLKTQSNDSPVQIDFIADSEATELDEDNSIVPAQNREVEKNDSEKVATTGEKNEGKKASGTVTLKNCTKTAGQVTLPAGTGVSSGEFTFVTQQAVTLPASLFTGTGACITPSKDVSVLATEAGDKYNLSSRNYTVAGRPGVSGVGSDMSGGTNKIVKVVSQKDIDSAKERLTSKQNSIQDEIKQELESEGYVAIPETFKASAANYNPSPGLDAEANEVTVSVTTKYTMLGVKKDDLKKLIEKEAKKDDTNNQQILLDDGIGKGKFKVGGRPGITTEGQVSINFSANVVIGPDINEDNLRNELAGKRKGAAEDLLKSRPGVLEPSVELSPFWVAEIPSKPNRVTFEIQQADGTKIE